MIQKLMFEMIIRKREKEKKKLSTHYYYSMIGCFYIFFVVVVLFSLIQLTIRKFIYFILIFKCPHLLFLFFSVLVFKKEEKKETILFRPIGRYSDNWEHYNIQQNDFCFLSIFRIENQKRFSNVLLQSKSYLAYKSLSFSVKNTQNCLFSRCIQKPNYFSMLINAGFQ